MWQHVLMNSKLDNLVIVLWTARMHNRTCDGGRVYKASVCPSKNKKKIKCQTNFSQIYRQ